MPQDPVLARTGMCPAGTSFLAHCSVLLTTAVVVGSSVQYGTVQTLILLLSWSPDSPRTSNNIIIYILRLVVLVREQVPSSQIRVVVMDLARRSSKWHGRLRLITLDQMKSKLHVVKDPANLPYTCRAWTWLIHWRKQFMITVCRCLCDNVTKREGCREPSYRNFILLAFSNYRYYVDIQSTATVDGS